MFDKLLFNRNAYDRDVTTPSLNLKILASGTMYTHIVIGTPIYISLIRGSGNMQCGLIMQQNVGTHIRGHGEFELHNLLLRLSMKLEKMNGLGQLHPGFSVQTPMEGAITGSGTMTIDTRMYLIQYMEAILSGHGDMDPGLVIQKSIYPEFHGEGVLHGDVDLPLSLTTAMTGTGEMVLRRLSALNENILELDGINLKPGETVTIDTRSLQVLFGNTEDVDSATDDSVFFELNPGENEIAISTDSNSKVDVTAIWQNRWL